MTAFPSIQELTELVNGFKEPFRLVWSSKSGEWKPSGDLIIMDASYNPPSRAHQDLAETALKQYGSSPSTELLLLFATVNATKAAAAKPLVPQRLAMMHQMAQDIAQESSTPISIALTSEPLFPRKAHIIHQSLPACRLKFIIGWDTLLNFFNPKYYDGQMPAVLKQFFEQDNAEILWSRRPTGFDEAALEAELFGREETQKYASKISRLERESMGEISSTNARKAAKDGDREGVLEYCSESITEFVLKEGLYRDLQAKQ